MIQLLLAVIYLSFISLGLPDSLLGAAWPAMYAGLGVPISYAGIISMIIALGTVVSSLLGDRFTRRWGTGRVTAVSVAMTAAALFGFSVSRSFLLLCLWAVPYGLGAGSVDASLNNYVAVHYASRHMSWLHCMWGIGASIGPWIMGRALTGAAGWSGGYRMISFLQMGLTGILLVTLPLWKKPSGEETEGGGDPLPLGQVVSLPGAREVMLSFFCYSVLEQTAGLWSASYLTLHKGLSPERAAALASLFFVGITIGRAMSGFLTLRLGDIQLIRLGEALAAAGIAVLVLPLGEWAALAGLLLVGLGCAPIYPCLIHATPARFGENRSQAVIGVQMASAYVGTCLMPPLFGLIANHIGIALLPLYLLLALAVMAASQERAERKSAGRTPA